MDGPSEALRDKVMVVTGAGSGLGAAVASLLIRNSAIPVVADVDPVRAEEVTHAITRGGGRALPLYMDVSDELSVRKALEKVYEELGRIDAVINSAGTDVTSPIPALADEDWTRVLRTNLFGPFFVTKHALPYMRAQAGGHVVNIASTASVRAWPNASAYHASKWGLLGLSHAMHAELRPLNIKVTAIIAGGMRTPFLLERFPDIDVGNLQEPEAVARAVLFALTAPADSVIPEMMVLPTHETSWP